VVEVVGVAIREDLLGGAELATGSVGWGKNLSRLPPALRAGSLCRRGTAMRHYFCPVEQLRVAGR
jgi:hypothetical protein